MPSTMDYSLVHRTPNGTGKILITTPGSPDVGSYATEAELKQYINQRVVKHTSDLPGSTTPINAAQLNGQPDTSYVKKYSINPSDWDTVPTNGSNKPVTSDGVYDAINAIMEKFTFVKPVSSKYTASGLDDLAKQIRANEFERNYQIFIVSCRVSTSDGCAILFINDSSTTAEGLPRYARGIHWSNSGGFTKFWVINGTYGFESF